MLQGSFETLSLPEVLGLLAGARKTGALYLDAGEVAGLVHLADGHCHAVDSTEQRGPLDDGGDLLMRLVDLCFTTMCQPSGSFRFEADEPAPWSCPEPVELSDALVEVDRLLKQWREILRVIPSLDCRPSLLEALEVDEVVLDRERWALLVAIDGRRTVREIVQRSARPVMDVCQTLLELVDAGAVGIIDPAAARAADSTVLPDAPAVEAPSPEVAARPEPDPQPVAEHSPPDEPAASEAAASEAAPAPVVLTIVPEVASEPALLAAGVPEPEAPDAPPVSESTEVPDQAVGEATGSEGPDRGAFLRLFSGLRES